MKSKMILVAVISLIMLTSYWLAADPPTAWILLLWLPLLAVGLVLIHRKHRAEHI